jgi:hypothetical protein
MGECEGVCAGTCDKKLKEPTCQGSLSLSETGECQTSCETLLLAETQCENASVDVTVTEPKNEEAAEHLKKTLSKHLPKIMQARALAIPPESVNSAIERTKAAIVAMNDALATPELELQAKQKGCAKDAAAKEAPAVNMLTYSAQAVDSCRLLIDP